MQPPAEDDLVDVASYVSAAQAELARARLAMDGIPARLGNAVFLLWCWHFSNAAGGVRVLVARRAARRARAILFARGTPPQWQPPPWACPKCRAEVDGMWQVCWACGTANDGTEDPAFFEEPEATQGLPLLSVERVVGLLTGGFLVLFLLAERPPEIFVVWLATMLCLGLRQAGEPRGDGGPDAVPLQDVEPPPSETSVPVPDAESEFDGMAVRAWRASVFALFSVPPLAIYAVWLLGRIARANAPLRPANRWRVLAAWVCGLLALPLGIVFLAVVLALPLYVLADSVACLFNVSGIAAPPP